MGWHCVQKHCQYAYVLNSYRSGFTSQFALWDSRLGTTSIWLPCDYLHMSKSLDYVCKTWDNTADYSKGWQWWQKPTVYHPTSHWCQSVKINWHHSKSTSAGHLLPNGREGFRWAPERAAIHWWCACSVSRLCDKTRHLIWAWWHSSTYNQSVFGKMKKFINLGPAWAGYILRLCFGKLETLPVTYELYRQQQLKC